MIGAILAGADEVSVARMQEAGAKLGLAFQIQDDILDVTGSFEKLGKPIGSDAENEKATYVTFEGLEQAKKDVERLSGEAIKILDEFDGEHTFLTAPVFLFGSTGIINFFEGNMVLDRIKKVK